MKIELQEIIRSEILALSAYASHDSNGMIKLDAMENPYSLPDELKQDWITRLTKVALNRYPTSDATALKEQIQKSFAISDKFEILLGNGSDELIQLILLAVATPYAQALTLTPSFSMYKMICTFIGVDCVEIPLNKNDFSLSMQIMREAIQKHAPKVVLLASPNNPTGNQWHADDISEIARISRGLVIIDEAYMPFAASSCDQLLDMHDNVLLLRTLSKLGLAGLRVGYLVGSARWIHELNKIRLPYNINILSQISAQFALQHYEVFKAQAKKICEQRAYLFDQLCALSGVKVFPSEANFLLIKLLNNKANDVFKKLVANKILVKDLSTHSMLNNCLRITVGTADENLMLLNLLKTVLGNAVISDDRRSAARSAP